MKYIALTVIALLMGISAVYSSGTTLPSDKNKEITATYAGPTDEYQYEFIDENGVSFLFDYIDDNVIINLYDDENIDVKFKITWIDTEEDEYDYDGEPTGKKVIKKTITKLEKV